jgi:hypothetical protein
VLAVLSGTANRNVISGHSINTTEQTLPFQFTSPIANEPEELAFVDFDCLVRNAEFLRSSQHIVQRDLSTEFGSISNGWRKELMFLLDNVSRNAVNDVVREKKNPHKVQFTR